MSLKVRHHTKLLIQHIHIIQYLTQQHQNKLVYNISYNYPSAVNKPQNTLIIIKINIKNLTHCPRDRAAQAAVPPELRHPGPGGRPGVQTGPADQGQAVEPRRGHPRPGRRVHRLQICLNLVTV